MFKAKTAQNKHYVQFYRKQMFPARFWEKIINHNKRIKDPNWYTPKRKTYSSTAKIIQTWTGEVSAPSQESMCPHGQTPYSLFCSCSKISNQMVPSIIEDMFRPLPWVQFLWNDCLQWEKVWTDLACVGWGIWCQLSGSGRSERGKTYNSEGSGNSKF